MTTRTLLFVTALLAVAGCSKKEEAAIGPRPTTTAEPTEVAAPAAAAAPAEEVNADDDPNLVVADDLEEKATQEVTGENLEKQLDSLEKEIGKSE